MDFPLTIIEPGIGQWRSADIGADEIPTDIRFHDDVHFSPLDAVFDARVTAVDSALDMAFLDIGEDRAATLNFRRARLLKKGGAHSISECVREGQMLRVQVVAEPSVLENKSLPVTPRARLMGRYIVAEAAPARLNLSKDLSAKRTNELKVLLAPLVKDVALIVRSRAGDVPTDAVLAEAKQLITALSTPIEGPGLVHAWTPEEKALLALGDGNSTVLVEGGSSFAAIKATAARFWPDVHARLQPYKSKDNAFEAYGVEEAVEEALSDRINLPSGGWISIMPTPALTAVDVNMGGALKGMSAGEAKLVVNMEATLALAHHLRFQDIGGLIVVDYIDMSAKGSSRELMQLIEKTFRGDRIPVQHTGISSFGLVEFTRKRTGLSLRDRMERRPAPVARTVAAAFDLLRCACRIGNSTDVGVLVLAGPKSMIGWIKGHAALIAELEAKTGRQTVLENATTPNTYIRTDGGPRG